MTLLNNLQQQVSAPVKAPAIIHAVVKGLGMQYFNISGTIEEINFLRKNPDVVMELVSATRAGEAQYDAISRQRLIADRVWEGFGPNRGGQYWSLGLAVDKAAASA